MKEIISFLKHFKLISVEMEKSNHPTLHLVWPAISRIDRFLKPSQADSVLCKKMKKAAVAYLKKNFELQKLLRIASFLHPQLKSLKFGDEAKRMRTIRDAKEMISTITLPQMNSDRLRRKNSTESVISDCFDEDLELDEVDLYAAYRVVGTEDMDIFDWWQRHKDSFPKLYNLAKFVLAIPATSAPSERKFSLAGKILNCIRSSLDPAKVSDLLLLHSNSDKFDRGLDES